MSLTEVMARTAEIESRLRALSTQGRGGGTLGVAGPAADAFRSELRTAQAPATGSATTAGSAAGTAAGSPSVGAASSAAPAATAPRAAGRSGTTGEDVVRMAESKAGTPYVWGGESMAEGGFDCSGLMQWTYKQFGIDLPRVSSQQARAGRAVSAAEARPGDLVFFDRTGRPDHIGMYAGGGEWIVAPKTGDVVKRQKVDLSEATTIRRVLPEGGGPGAASLRATGAPVGAPAAGDWASRLPPAGRRYAGLVQEAATKAGVDPRLLGALAWSESGFDPSARSPAGARGLVQLMPATARGLGVTDTSDPAQSLAGGARYLRQQLDAFRGDPRLALAAYNAGPTAVRRHGGVPPYAETQKYVQTVLSRYTALGGSA